MLSTAPILRCRETVTVAEVPPSSYTKTASGLHIAYKAMGDGAVDLLCLWQPPLAFDATFEHPGHIRYWQFMMSFARVIGFDQRGIGASDPAPPESFSDRDAWLEDSTAVLEAVGAEHVVVLGEGFGSHPAITLAARFPERVRGLALINAFATNPVADIDVAVAAVERVWGTGAVVGRGVPHLATGPSFQQFCARYERAAASPATAGALVRAMRTSDVRDLLAAVSTPTLVMYTGDLPFTTVEQSRYLAEHIDNATFRESVVESFWDLDPVARLAIQEFISGVHAEVSFERELLAVLFTDIVSSTEQLFAAGDAGWQRRIDDHDTYVRDCVTRTGGRVIKHTGDGHLAAFGRPSDAVQVAVQLRDAAVVHGFDVRIGLHFGEVTARGDGDITGTNVTIAARIMQSADAGEVVISRTVADLIAGSSVRLTDRGDHQLKGVPGEWKLFTLDL